MCYLWNGLHLLFSRYLSYTQGNKCTHANVRRKGCCRHSQRCFLNDAQRKIRSVRIRQPTTRQPTTRPPTKTAFKWRALGKEKEGRRAGQKTQAPKTRHAKDSSQWRPGSTAAGVCETHAGEGGTARSPSRGDPPAKKGFHELTPYVHIASLGAERVPRGEVS